MILLFFYFLTLILFCSSIPIEENQNSNFQNDQSILNVHLVPHTHDDVGWLKTVDQYYAGLNEAVQKASVKSIIDSVMISLSKNVSRKFIYVEMAFFWRWWNEQTSDTQEQVHKFVKNGQLEFINGGWCMHDEATTHFQSMIDQTTEGHLFLNDTFNIQPIAQWQIDPFGHSSANAELSVQIGLESLFFARNDYIDYQKRVKTQELEMLWYPSKSLSNISIFTQIFANQAYGAPDGFSWDITSQADPFQDDPLLNDYNVDTLVDSFYNYCINQSANYRSNHFLIPMGSDFNFRQAEDFFSNIDKLIYYTNKKYSGKINLFYSTPSIYTKMARAAYSSWPINKEDFFPYGDAPHSYWTGYFTSRPALKRMERYGMAYLQACKQIETHSNQDNRGQSIQLRHAIGVAQHHDAVSGTEKQVVAYDYAKRISIGLKNCESLISSTLSNAAKLSNNFFSCHLLNVSVCDQTVNPKNQSIKMIAYNSLAISRKEIIQIPIYSSNGASVSGSEGIIITQVIPNSQETIRIGSIEGGAKRTGNYTLAFQIQIPPLGYSVYTIDFTKPATHPYLPYRNDININSNDILLENSEISLSFNSTTGELIYINNHLMSSSMNMTQNLYQYYSSIGNKDSEQVSSAYIFRPTKNSADLININPIITNVIKGPLIQEIRQKLTNDISQVVRLYKNESFAEFEYSVAVNISDGLGKEIISRFSTKIENMNEWFTDSNSREMQYRVKNHGNLWPNMTEPVAQNYYPATSAVFLNDSSVRLTILLDRAQGCASLDKGEIELMLHRRTLEADHRGTHEPLNETGADGNGLIVRTKHWVIVAPQKNSSSLQKSLTERLVYEPILLFSDNNTQHEIDQTLSLPKMKEEFPENVHLLTKQILNDNEKSYLVRVNHIYEVNEDPILSQPATISLSSVFPEQQIVNVDELSLSANKINTNNPQKPTIQNNFSVLLNPMEIRTFRVFLSS